MSLDVYLRMPGCEDNKQEAVPRIFIREDGQTKEISRQEWDKRYPGVEPVTFTGEKSECVYEANITHNLGKMAAAADIYMHVWRPEEIGITKAYQLIVPLQEGIAKMEDEPAKYKEFDATNGWGTYEQFLPWLNRYLEACKEYPDADVSVSI